MRSNAQRGSIKIKVARGDRRKDPLSLFWPRNFSLSPVFIFNFIFLVVFPRPSSSAHLSLVFNRKVECTKGEEKKKIFIYLEESFAFIPTARQGSSTVKKGIKDEEISISAPGSTNVKSNFRHWKSKEGFSISRSFFFPLFFLFLFFFPCKITLSFLLIFLSDRYSPSVCTSFRINRYFYFAPIRMADARLPRFLVHLGN